MTTPTIVIVPVRDAIQHTRNFLDCMREQSGVDRVIVLDNGSKRATRDLLADRAGDGVERVDAAGLGIYEMWNRGFAHALVRYAPLIAHEPVETIERGAINVLISNNDIVLPDGAVAELARHLRASPPDLWAVYPDYYRAWDARSRRSSLRVTEGVLGDGGLFGACFMLAGERIPWTPLVSDPSYEWWFGDNHLARQIQEEGGRQARVVGLPVAHVNEGTARAHAGLQQMKQRDRARWIDSQRRRRETTRPARKMVPGTKVWRPGGARRDEY